MEINLGTGMKKTSKRYECMTTGMKVHTGKDTKASNASDCRLAITVYY